MVHKRDLLHGRAMKWTLGIFPVFLSVVLVAWTIFAYPYLQNGDDWLVLPVIGSLPVLLVSDTTLVIISKAKSRIFSLLYVLVHGAIFVIVWLACIVLLSSDSL